MRSLQLVVLLTSFLVLSWGCQKIEDVKKDPPVIEEDDPWTSVEFPAQTQITHTLATPFELYFIASTEFFRLGPANQLVEKRLLLRDNNVFGVPALSFNTFARLTQTFQGKYLVEFNLTKTSGETITFGFDQLDPLTSNVYQPDFMGRHIGAFNPDGTLFLLPAINITQSHYTFFLFEIDLDAQTFHFEGINVIEKYDITEMSTVFNNLGSIRFLNGNFYIASKEGGFRISEEGEVSKFTNKWMKDFFIHNGNIYATGFENSDFFISSDNGETWEKMDNPSPLKFVSVANDTLLSQEFAGHQFSVGTEDFQTIQPLKLNEDFPDVNDFYYSISYFAGKYYFTVGKELYYSDRLAIEE